LHGAIEGFVEFGIDETFAIFDRYDFFVGSIQSNQEVHKFTLQLDVDEFINVGMHESSRDVTSDNVPNLP
jgi:hypothetical protein